MLKTLLSLSSSSYTTTSTSLFRWSVRACLLSTSTSKLPDLSYNNIHLSILIILMDYVATIKNLKNLTLASNRIGAAKDSNHVQNLGLNDYGNNSSKNSAEIKQFVLKIQEMASLNELNLSNNYIGNDIIKELEVLRNLKVLDLSWNEIGKEGAEIIGEMLGNMKMEILNVSWNSFGGVGAIGIVKKIHLNTNLRILALNGNKIGENEISEIVSCIEKNHNIQVLHLNCNMITSFPKIVPLLKHRSLKILDITDNLAYNNRIHVEGATAELVQRENKTFSKGD